MHAVVEARQEVGITPTLPGLTRGRGKHDLAEQSPGEAVNPGIPPSQRRKSRAP